MTPGVDSWIHRVVTSEYYRGQSLVEIQTQWNHDDLLDAIIMLDAYSYLSYLARLKAPK